MREGLQGRFVHPRQLGVEVRVTLQPGSEHRDVHKCADEILDVEVIAHANGDIGLACMLMQHHVERSDPHHREASCAVSVAESAQRNDVVRVQGQALRGS